MMVTGQALLECFNRADLHHGRCYGVPISNDTGRGVLLCLDSAMRLEQLCGMVSCVAGNGYQVLF